MSCGFVIGGRRRPEQSNTTDRSAAHSRAAGPKHQTRWGVPRLICVNKVGSQFQLTEIQSYNRLLDLSVVCLLGKCYLQYRKYGVLYKCAFLESAVAPVAEPDRAARTFLLTAVPRHDATGERSEREQSVRACGPSVPRPVRGGGHAQSTLRAYADLRLRLPAASRRNAGQARRVLG